MKKYNPIIILTIAIGAILIYCITRNKSLIIGGSVQKEIKKDSSMQEIGGFKLLMQRLSKNSKKNDYLIC